MATRLKKKNVEDRVNEFKAMRKRPIIGIINTIMRTIKDWATSKNKRNSHLSGVMTIGAYKRLKPKKD